MVGKRWVLALCGGLAIAVILAGFYRRRAQRPGTVAEPTTRPLNWTPQQTLLSTDEVRIPIELDGGIPLIPFTSTDGRRWRLAFDTGANSIITTPAFAAAMRSTTQPTSLAYHDAAASGTMLEVATFRTFALNGATFCGFDAGVMEIRAPYDALLGWPLWRDLLVTIDYPKRMLVLTQGSLPEPDGQWVLPLRVGCSGQLEIPVTLDGHDRWLELDTGCGEPDCVQLTPATAATVAWETLPTGSHSQHAAGHVFAEKLGRLKADVVLGRYRFTKVSAATNGGADDDLLGAWILENFTVTLDLKHLRAKFYRPNNIPIRFADTFDRGFRCNSHGPIRIVLSVLRRSKAEHAGLRRGDIVLRINGHPATDDTAGYDSSKPLVLDILRGFKPLTIRFGWTDLDR